MYRGGFKKGFFDGFGTWFLEDGQKRYEGVSRRGAATGPGVFWDP